MDRKNSLMLDNVLKVIRTASESLDRYRVRRRALDAMFHTISAEGAIFFLPDGNDRFSDIMLKNLEERYNKYYQTYYHVFDPLRLIQRKCKRCSIQRLEQVVSYDSFEATEYYNDFLKPQKIHHKLVVNLKTGTELHGKIVLTRPKKSPRFNKKEIRFAKALSPYLANALALNDLRRKVKLKGNILNYIEEESSIGMILLDETLHSIYRNQKAAEILENLTRAASDAHSKDQIFSQLLENCREIKAKLKQDPAESMVISKQKIVRDFHSTRFSICLKTFEQEQGWEGSRLFMICIEELPESANFDGQFLIDSYQLSNREVDVVRHLFSGLSNAEIAKKLFITEATVKKHLQNIFSKVGVKNRTSLINRVLYQ